MKLPPHIGCVYLHGFLSSPESTKARQLSDYFYQYGMSNQLVIPALDFEPARAIAQAELAVEDMKGRSGISQVMVIGSSLGGYYATWLSQKYNCKAVLINPAVKPFDLFAEYLGPNTHFYSGEVHELTMEHIEQLQQLNVETLAQPDQLLLLLQTGDETLDYRLAADKYSACPGWLESGGDHSFSGFMDRLPGVFYFAEGFAEE